MMMMLLFYVDDDDDDDVYVDDGDVDDDDEAWDVSRCEGNAVRLGGQPVRTNSNMIINVIWS